MHTNCPDDLILPPELTTHLLTTGTIRQFPRNSIIVVEGEPAETLYLVVEGRLRVYVSDETGREVELNQHGPGEYFGELMLGSGVRTASVRAMEPSRLCLVGREQFVEFIRDNPALTMHVIHTLVHRVKSLTDNVQSLALLDVYGRLRKLFNDMSRHGEDGLSSLPGISQQKIAERIGASRAMVNRILRDLTEGGYIRISDDGIEILRSLPKKW